VLNPIFKTQPLSLLELAVCLGAAAVVWVAAEAEKAWRWSRRQRDPAIALDAV
jgi:Ca2+-transporting ATPase